MREAEPGAGVADEVAGGQVVGPVEHDVVVGEDVEGGDRREAGPVLDHLDVRVERADGVGGRRRLGPADIGVAVDHLALEVRRVDDVVVDDPEGPDARGGEVEQRRGAQPAGPDDEDPGGTQPPLPVPAHLRQEEVPRVAGPLRGGQLGTRREEGRHTHAGTIQAGRHAAPSILTRGDTSGRVSVATRRPRRGCVA